MKPLAVIGAPAAVRVEYGLVEGNLRLVAAFDMHVVAEIPADKATPELVARQSERLVAMLVVEATKALNPELAQAVEDKPEPPAEEPKPS